MKRNILQIKQEIENELGFGLIRRINPIYDQKEKDDSIVDRLSHVDIGSGKLDRAEKMVLETLQSDPNNELFWATLGYIYYIKGEFSKSVKCFFKTIEIDPKNIDNWIDLGFSYRAYGDFKTSDFLFLYHRDMISDYLHKFDKMSGAVLFSLIKSLNKK